MSIHQEFGGGKVTFVAIAQHNGSRLKKRFPQTKFQNLEAALKAALDWERQAKLNSRLQEQLGINISARGMADLANWDERAKAMGADLRLVFEEGFRVLQRQYDKGLARALAFGEAIGEYFSELEARNRSEDYLRVTRLRLEVFAKDFGDQLLDEIQPEAIQDWLQKRRFKPKGSNAKGRPLGSTAWRNWRTDLRAFFSWARKKNYLLEANPADGVIVKSKSRQELAAAPPIWSAEYLQRVIDHCRTTPGQLADLPYFVLGALAGLRPKETERLRWEDFAWDQSPPTVWIRSAIAKTRAHRHVELVPNLVEILKPFRRQTGPVCPASRAIYQRLRRAKFDLPVDALRHSFASWSSVVHGPEKTALAMGHCDSDLLYNTYRSLLPKESAAKYLGLK